MLVTKTPVIFMDNPMYNPPHPGEVIKEFTGFKTSRKLARVTGLTRAEASSLLACEISVTPEIAQKLSTGIGMSLETWLKLQSQYSVWQIEKNCRLIHEINELEKAYIEQESDPAFRKEVALRDSVIGDGL
jgi:addiction module HigA family antidote